MINKDKLWIYGGSIIIGILLFWMFCYPIIRHNYLPENNVYVEWVVYTNSGPVNYHGTYLMTGNKFTTRYTSHRGSNTVCIVNNDPYGNCYIGNESTCIYVGTNDVSIRKIEVIK